MPDTLSFDEAATIPLGLATVAAGLFHGAEMSNSVGLYPPWEDGGRGKYAGEPILILGGATSVGQYGAWTTYAVSATAYAPAPVTQMCKLAGFSPIITTASPRNTDTLKRQGATHVLDRNLSDEALLAEVQKIAAPIKVVLDAVSDPQTQNIAYRAVAPGGTLAILLPSTVERVVPEKRIVQTVGNTNVPQNRKLGASCTRRSLPFWRKVL